MHLIKSPSGILHFRIRIPKSAQRYFQGRTEIKKTLMTKKKRIAQPIASKLYESHKNALRNILLELADGTEYDKVYANARHKKLARKFRETLGKKGLNDFEDQRLMWEYVRDRKAGFSGGPIAE